MIKEMNQMYCYELFNVNYVNSVTEINVRNDLQR